MENAALVLEGGAIRGIFSAGVLDFLMEREVQFPYVASVSAGTCCAMGYLSGQIGRTRACMMPDPETRYYGLQQLRESGKLMDLRKIFLEYPYGRFPFDFSAYFTSGIEHEIVVTDRADGLPRYLQERSDEMRLSLGAMASCSIPLLNAPVELDGRFYYDGGVGDSIPVGRALSKGYGKVVAVLTRRAGVYPEVSAKAQAAYRVFFRHDPQFRDAILSRPARYRAQMAYLSRLEAQGRAFLIRPMALQLNDAGYFIWKLLEETPCQKDALLQAFSEHYTAPMAQATAYVGQFLEQMLSNGFVYETEAAES